MKPDKEFFIDLAIVIGFILFIGCANALVNAVASAI